ncbi:MAG: S8 family serine peptidase, partial [Bacteroidota bacterium]
MTWPKSTRIPCFWRCPRSFDGIFGGRMGVIAVTWMIFLVLGSRVFAQSSEEPPKNLPRRIQTEGILAEFKALRNGGLPPLYYQTYNQGAAQTSRTNRLWPGGGLGLQLSGQRLTLCCLNGPNGSQPYFYDPKVGIWDGGGVRATHQELAGRVTQRDAATSSDNHATHVAGTMIASGEQPSARGMAYSAKLDAYDWNSDESEMAAAGAQGLLMSNHSYGLVSGWAYGDFDGQGTSRWFWWGSEADTVCADFGLYSEQARDWDLIANNAPNYLMVKAAGNDRGQGPSPGTTHRVWSNSLGNWVNSTTTRQKDGGALGYDCISHAGVAKNVLTVGAVQGITGTYTAPSQVIGSTFHGWGPTDDGRIKPDIVAKGVGVYSTTAASDVSYASYNGTSMASPVVTGTLALLQQRWTEIHAPLLGTPPPPMTSAQLKALVCHTALEAGLPGPDPVFGWGLLNAEGAVQLMAGRGDTTLLESFALNNAGTYSRAFYSDGQQPLVVTLAWNDPAAPISTYTVNNPVPVLVNDLDLRLVRSSDGAVFEPYRLVAGQPGTAAQTGDNTRDNLEQVRLISPTPGIYTLQITHKGALSGNQPQAFALVASGLRLKSTLSGQIRYSQATGTGLRGLVAVYRENDGVLVATTTSNAQGQYSVSGLETGTYKVKASALMPPAGVNGTDALLVARHFARSTQLSGMALEAADVSANRIVNATDALQIALRFTNQWSNPEPLALMLTLPTNSPLASAPSLVARLAASTDSLGPASYTVGTWGQPTAATLTTVVAGRQRMALNPLTYFASALPNPWTSGTLPARLEVLYREIGPCGGFGGVTRPCLEQGTPSGQPIPMWLSANPPLTGWLQMQA